jgi:periplasmic copper chaperone A
MSMDNGVMKMRPLEKGLAIDPGKTVKLAPGGYHLMMMDLKSPLKRGDKVPATLEFEKAGKVKLLFDVQGFGAQGPTTSPSSGSKKDMNGMSPGMKMRELGVRAIPVRQQRAGLRVSPCLPQGLNDLKGR